MPGIYGDSTITPKLAHFTQWLAALTFVYSMVKQIINGLIKHITA